MPFPAAGERGERPGFGQSPSRGPDTMEADAIWITDMLGGVIGSEVDFTAFFVRRYFGSAAFGRLYGLAFGIFIVGTGTGPVLFNSLFDRFGGYQPGVLLFAATAVVIVVFTFAMPAAGRHATPQPEPR